MEVVLAGASGLIGPALATSLRADGHRVKTLVRPDGPAARTSTLGSGPGAARPDLPRPGADAVVCLSGAGVGDHRWTDAYKRRDRRSRIDSVGDDRAAAVGRLRRPRAVFVAASAVGYYGDTGDRIVDEERRPGDHVPRRRLRATGRRRPSPPATAGVRVVHLRTGLVLAQARRPAQAADADRPGRRRPASSATAGSSCRGSRCADEVRGDPLPARARGARAGEPDRPRPGAQCRVHRRARHACCTGRPCCRRPAFALRAVLGEFADEVLTGQRAVPGVLTPPGSSSSTPTSSRRCGGPSTAETGAVPQPPSECPPQT